MAEWITNGEPVQHVSINDRGFQYGDGLFETIAIRKGEPRLWQYHVDRLTRGCEVLRIAMPTESELLDGVTQALEHSDVSAAYSIVKLIVSSGSGLRGYGRGIAESPTVLYRAFPAAPPALESYRDGIDVTLCETRLASDSATAGLKTLNRLEQVLARSEFVGSNVFEGLTMDADDNIICGTMSNVFFINKKIISTPALDRSGVEGVMRRHVIETLREQGIDTMIRASNLMELENADEVFLSNSQFGVLPVRSCRDLRWPVGEVTLQVMSSIANTGVTECRQ
jgi:4-amino-4-deoxychorismate lyase